MDIRLGNMVFYNTKVKNRRYIKTFIHLFNVTNQNIIDISELLNKYIDSKIAWEATYYLICYPLKFKYCVQSNSISITGKYLRYKATIPEVCKFIEDARILALLES